uniref:Uncharacterized protein n=1 Tax=Anopheles maculatus TaxID=74869 RepID=A0A182SSC5_9DIPT
MGPGATDFGCFGSGTIHSKIIGTVYDLDFDEEIVCGRLRDMRDRRRSIDGRSADASGASVGSGGGSAGQAGGSAAGGPDAKSSRSGGGNGTAGGGGAGPGGTGANSGYGSTGSSVATSSLPDMAVLPGPVDMRTYNSGFDSSSNTDAYNNQLLGVFASGTADQTLADIDEDMENELQSALKADSVSNRSAAAAAASLAQTNVQTNTTSTGGSSLLAAVTATANSNSNSSSSVTSESTATSHALKTGSMATGVPFVPSITPPCATGPALPGTMLSEDPMIEQPQEETNDSDSLLPIATPNQQQQQQHHHKMSSLADSRNIMKLKIKGPLAQLDSSGVYGAGTAGAAGSSASAAVVSQLQQSIGMASTMGVPMGPGAGGGMGVVGGVGGVGGVAGNVAGGAAGSSNLRRMRKKELLRQYWNQDMNQDDPQAVLQSADHHHLHHHHHHHAQGLALGGVGHGNRTTVGFPKAVESLGTMPTKDDYKEYGGIHRKKLSSNMSRELRQLASVPQTADHHELLLAERRRSVGGSVGVAGVAGASTGPGANGSAMNLSMDDVSGVGIGGVGIGVVGAGGMGGGAGGKRRSRANRANATSTATVTAVSQQTPQQAPKLKIKLGSGIVDGGPYGMGSLNAGPSTSSSLRPPKKRLACSVPPPSLEDLKREYMMYAENISFEDDGPGGAADDDTAGAADSGDDEPKAKKHKHKDKDRDRSGSEHKKRKKEKKHKRDKGDKQKVEIICNAAVAGDQDQAQQQPPRIVIRLGVKKSVQSDESHAPSPQSQIAVTGAAGGGSSLGSPQKTPVNEERTATRSSGCSSSPETDPLVIDLAAIHNTNSRGQSLQPSPEMDHRTVAAQAAPAEKPLITPIRLKLARNSAGGGYVMSSKQNAAAQGTDCGASDKSVSNTSPPTTMDTSPAGKVSGDAAAGTMDLSTSAAEVAAATSSKNMIERLITAANLVGSSPTAFERAMGAAAVAAAAATASSNGASGGTPLQQQQQSHASGSAFATMYGMSSIGGNASNTTSSSSSSSSNNNGSSNTNASMSFKSLLDFAASTNTTFSTCPLNCLLSGNAGCVHKNGGQKISM